MFIYLILFVHVCTLSSGLFANINIGPTQLRDSNKSVVLNKFRRSRKTLYTLTVAIFLIAVFLRFYNFNANSVIWLGDQGWDLIVARNILYNNLRPQVGPILFVPNFYTPPTYYYFLASLLFIGKSPIGTNLLFQFMNIISLIILFLLIRELLDNWAGLIGSLLFATSQDMIYQSRVMWQPHATTLFIILALYFLVFAFKKRKMLFLWVSYTSYFIALSIYPGSVVLAPYFIWQMLRFRRKIQKNKSVRLFNITLIACFVSFLLIYSPQIYYESQNNFPTLGALRSPAIDDSVKIAGRSRFSIYLMNMEGLLENFFRIRAFGGPLIYSTYFLMIIFLVLLFYINERFKALPPRLAEKYEFANHVISFPSLVVGSLSFLWFRIDPHPHRSLAYMPFLFIILANILHLAFDLKNSFYKVAISLILIITIVANLKFVWKYINYSSLWLPTSNQVAEYIISDINKGNLDTESTSTFLISPGDFYGSDLHPILYLLQERINYPVYFVEAGNDVDRGALMYSKKPTLYLICRGYESRYDAEKQCLERFLKVNSSYVTTTYEDVNFRFKVFKLTLIET